MLIIQDTLKHLHPFVGFVTYLISLMHGQRLFKIKPVRVRP